MDVIAEMKTDSKNPKAVCAALMADNEPMNGLDIQMNYDKQINTTVKAKSLTSLRSTLDDILACQIAAEKVI